MIGPNSNIAVKLEPGNMIVEIPKNKLNVEPNSEKKRSSKRIANKRPHSSSSEANYNPDESNSDIEEKPSTKRGRSNRRKLSSSDNDSEKDDSRSRVGARRAASQAIKSNNGNHTINEES